MEAFAYIGLVGQFLHRQHHDRAAVRNGTNTGVFPLGFGWWCERRWRWRGALVGSPGCSHLRCFDGVVPRLRSGDGPSADPDGPVVVDPVATRTSTAGGDDRNPKEHAHTPHHRELEHPFIMPAVSASADARLVRAGPRRRVPMQ
jgi:hypothetical protein